MHRDTLPPQAIISEEKPNQYFFIFFLVGLTFSIPLFLVWSQTFFCGCVALSTCVFSSPDNKESTLCLLNKTTACEINDYRSYVYGILTYEFSKLVSQDCTDWRMMERAFLTLLPSLIFFWSISCFLCFSFMGRKIFRRVFEFVAYFSLRTLFLRFLIFLGTICVYIYNCDRSFSIELPNHNYNGTNLFVTLAEILGGVASQPGVFNGTITDYLFYFFYLFDSILQGFLSCYIVCVLAGIILSAFILIPFVLSQRFLNYYFFSMKDSFLKSRLIFFIGIVIAFFEIIVAYYFVEHFGRKDGPNPEKFKPEDSRVDAQIMVCLGAFFLTLIQFEHSHLLRTFSPHPLDSTVNQ